MDSLKLEFREIIGRETIDGKVYLMAGTSTAHGHIVGNLLSVFTNYLKGKKCKVYGENISVKFDEANEVLPDIKIVCDPDKIKRNGIEGAPDFIAEVLSTRTRKKDETEKKDIYEKHGVKEYWIVDTDRKTIEVNILINGRYVKDYTYTRFDEYDIKDIEATGNEEEKEMIKITTLKTSIFGDDLIINIDDVFENIE